MASHTGQLIPQHEPAVRVSNLHRSFNEAGGVLNGLDLEIPPGEFVVLLGKSGCGKSTLLRALAGLDEAVEGSGLIAVPERVSVVFQDSRLLPWATVLDNVLFPLKMMKRLTPESPKQAMRLIELVGLSGFERKYPRELSGGMQMRVGICRSLVHNPDILLMDEPFSALDALTREELTLELMRIWREQPKTVLFVTHSIPESVMLADRVVVLSPRPGRIAEIINVNVPRPRQFGMEARDEFQHAAGRIRQLIFGAGRKSLH